MYKFFIAIFALCLITTVFTPAAEASNTVYITQQGKKYHKQDCKTIAKSSTAKTTIQEAKKQGYKPCKVCKPNK